MYRGGLFLVEMPKRMDNFFINGRSIALAIVLNDGTTDHGGFDKLKPGTGDG